MISWFSRWRQGKYNGLAERWAWPSVRQVHAVARLRRLLRDMRAMGVDQRFQDEVAVLIQVVGSIGTKVDRRSLTG